MPIIAKMSFRYLWRLAVIALICLFMSLYCLYDGAVVYPKDAERAKAYRELKEQTQDNKDEFYRRWDEIVLERGWPQRKPKDSEDITVQFWMAACIAPPGLLYLFLFLRSRPRWIELNENGLRASWGPKLGFEQIVGLDKRKWKSKGIAKLLYEQDGQKRCLTLDDWKYDTPATKQILREVEARIDHECITGGPAEPPEDTVNDSPVEDTTSQVNEETN